MSHDFVVLFFKDFMKIYSFIIKVDTRNYSFYFYYSQFEHSLTAQNIIFEFSPGKCRKPSFSSRGPSLMIFIHHLTLYHIWKLKIFENTFGTFYLFGMLFAFLF